MPASGPSAGPAAGSEGGSEAAPGAGDQFVCFVYHRFGDDRYPTTNISIDTFRRQLEFLRDEGFSVLTLSEALARRDRGDLSGPTVVLTVDDGFASFASGAWPLLREFGFPATLFVSTAAVGGDDMLSWEQLVRIAAAGIEIGNHTASHAYFLNLPAAGRAASLRAATDAAQVLLQQRLGRAPTVFSYPYGELDPAMRDAVRDLGFIAAAAQNSGVVGPHADPFALPRFPMGGVYATLAGFRAKARMRELPVVAVAPASAVLEGPGPPRLHLRVLTAGLRLSGTQCFVAGQPACSLRVSAGADTADITVRARAPLRARRTLYTITAPARQGPAWHWFSRVWVRPGQAE